MTDIPPTNPETNASDPSIAAFGKTTDASMVLTQNDDQRLALHVGQDLKADVLGLSLKATPPGKYVKLSTRGKVSWNNKPQYFSFNKIEQSKSVSAYIVEELGIASRLPFDSHVEIASRDGFFAASTIWKIRPKAGVIYQSRLWIAIALLLVVGSIVVAGLNFSQLSESACTRWSFCSADQIGFQEVKLCSSRAGVCGQATCVNQFFSKFPSSRFISSVEKIRQDGVEQCRVADEDKYELASRCVQERINADPCNVRLCFDDNEVIRASERASQAKTIVAVAAERCRRLAENTATERKQLALEPQQPAPQPQEPAPIAPQPILVDGSHQAVQRYNGPRSRLDPLNCPASANFAVEVRGETFTYSRPDFFDGTPITRTWIGTINQTSGQIAVLGSKGLPPTKNAMTVVGAYDGATVLSDFCGFGIFKIER